MDLVSLIKHSKLLFAAIYFLCWQAQSEPMITSNNNQHIYDLARASISEHIDKPTNTKIIITPQKKWGKKQFQKCSGELSAELATKRQISTNNTVKINCTSLKGLKIWSTYISVKVEILYPVVISNEHIAANELIAQQHLKIAWRDKNQLRGQFFSKIAEVIGSRSKRRISKNTPIFNSNLCFICKGDNVSIFARTATLEIKAIGQALDNGIIGDTIAVLNLNSKKVIDAKIKNIGEVEVIM